MAFNQLWPYTYFTVCTPLGFARLFTVLSQLLVGPLRDLDEEVMSKQFEIDGARDQLKRRAECGEMVDSVSRAKIMTMNMTMSKPKKRINKIFRGTGLGQSFEEEDEEDFMIPKTEELLMKAEQMQSLNPQRQKEAYEEEAVLKLRLSDLQKQLLSLGNL
jgi:hypothetical protein